MTRRRQAGAVAGAALLPAGLLAAGVGLARLTPDVLALVALPAAPLEDVVLAALWAVATVVTCWWSVAALGAIAAHAAGAPRLAARLARATAPVLRRHLEGRLRVVAATGSAASLLAGPALAQVPQPTATVPIEAAVPDGAAPLLPPWLRDVPADTPAPAKDRPSPTVDAPAADGTAPAGRGQDAHGADDHARATPTPEPGATLAPTPPDVAVTARPVPVPAPRVAAPSPAPPVLAPPTPAPASVVTPSATTPPAATPSTPPSSASPALAPLLPAPDASATVATPPRVLPAAAPDTATEVVVAPGDHLWSLAAAQVTAARGRAATTVEIAAHWHVIVRAVAVPSGDPDLVHPGDRLLLPPVAAAPTAPVPAARPEVDR